MNVVRIWARLGKEFVGSGVQPSRAVSISRQSTNETFPFAFVVRVVSDPLAGLRTALVLEYTAVL